MRQLAPILVALTGCTMVAVTPPSRAFPMTSPIGPAPQHADVQVDLAHSGRLFGPELDAGGQTVRYAVTPTVTLEGDAGELHVSSAGDGPNRNGYTGRVGAMLSDETHHAAVEVGMGGGYAPAAGGWHAMDAGVWFTGSNRYVRPVLGGTLGYSAPFGERRFTVSTSDTSVDGTGDSETATLRLPHNVYAQLTVGVEVGPPTCALWLGMNVSSFWLLDSSTPDDPSAPADQLQQTFAGIGLGARVQL